MSEPDFSELETELETELDAGDMAGEALCEHIDRMGAGGLYRDVEVEGTIYRIRVAREGSPDFHALAKPEPGLCFE